MKTKAVVVIISQLIFLYAGMNFTVKEIIFASVLYSGKLASPRSHGIYKSCDRTLEDVSNIHLRSSGLQIPPPPTHWTGSDYTV
jgi:hypothetical protein